MSTNTNGYKAHSTHSPKRKLSRPVRKQFDLIEAGARVGRLDTRMEAKKNLRKALAIRFTRFRSIRLHVVLCRACKPQLIAPHGKDTLSGVANLPGDAKSGVEQKCLRVCVYVCVCVSRGVGDARLIVLVCFAGDFKPRCIRTGAVRNSLFA